MLTFIVSNKISSDFKTKLECSNLVRIYRNTVETKQENKFN